VVVVFNLYQERDDGRIVTELKKIKIVFFFFYNVLLFPTQILFSVLLSPGCLNYFSLKLKSYFNFMFHLLCFRRW